MIKLLCWCPACKHRWIVWLFAWENDPLVCPRCGEHTSAAFGPVWQAEHSRVKQILMAHMRAFGRIGWHLMRTPSSKSPGNSA